MVYEQEEKGGEDVEVNQLGKSLAASLEQGSGGVDRWINVISDYKLGQIINWTRL